MRKILSVLMLLALVMPVWADRYYIHSNNILIEKSLGPIHKFEDVFSADLTDGQLRLLQKFGIEVEEVSVFYLTKPFCNNNGVCERNLGENPSCADCKSATDPIPDPDRGCYPIDSLPWGIVKVNGGSGGEGITVAVLDTGVDKNHPDLESNIIDCVSKVTHYRPDSRKCDDHHGHGTHVAGTILANGGSDGLGIFGVAPDAKLMAIKICDRTGACYGDDIAAGLRYATDNGANIVSMSLGSRVLDSQVLAGVNYATDNGVLVIAASGNDGPALNTISYPAAYPNVIAVGATDSNNVVTYFSSRGVNDGDYIVEEREIEFAAPGLYIYSTLNDGCYGTMSGTSMATPHVSGLAAKLWSGSAFATRARLWNVSKDIDAVGDDPASGFGLPVAT